MYRVRFNIAEDVAKKDFTTIVTIPEKVACDDFDKIAEIIANDEVVRVLVFKNKEFGPKNIRVKAVEKELPTAIHFLDEFHLIYEDVIPLEKLGGNKDG